MNRALTPVLFASFILTACGGGGSGITPGGGGPGPGTGGNGLPLTGTNAPAATNTAWQSANQTAGVVGLVGSGGVISNPGNVNKVRPAVKSATLMNILQQVPIPPTTQPCLVSGTLTISGDLANPLTLTPNDIINVSAAMCDDGAGEVLDGDLSMVVDAFAGDVLAGLYSLTMTVSMTSLTATSAADSITSDGSATVTIDTSQSPFVATSVSGASLMTSTNTATETLTNFQTSQTVDGGLQNLPFTLSSSGTLDSSELSGVINYSTPVTFTGEGFGFPSAGEFLITGDDSSARLIAVDDANVRIEIDNDGDGVIDETLNLTWVELTSS